MAKYIEEYLVALGFDLDSKEGKEYLSMLNDLEKKQNELDKQSKSSDGQAKKRQDNQKKRLEDGKKEINLMGDMGKTIKQIGTLWAGIETGDVFGSFLKGMVSVKSLSDFLKSIGESVDDDDKRTGKFGQTLSDLFKKSSSKIKLEAEQPKQNTDDVSTEASAAGNAAANSEIATVNIDTATVNIKAAMEPTKNTPSANRIIKAVSEPSPTSKEPVFDAEKNKPNLNVFKTASEQAKGLEAGLSEARGIEAGITGATAAGGAAEGAEAAAGAAGVAGVAGVAGGAALGVISAVALPVAIAAAAVAAGAAMVKMADELSKAEINVESMSRKLWISEDSAWKLNNTLAAMGKTTADLNEIALNPTLRKQYEELSKYQKEQLKLPDDFRATNKEWANSVGLAAEKLRLSSLYTKELFSYDMEKAFARPLAAILNFMNDVVNDIAKIEKFFDKASTNPLGVGGELLGFPNKNNLSNGSGETGNSSAAAYSNGDFANYANGAAYAPQNYDYSSTKTSNVTVSNTPNITVYAQSSDPQAIASTTAGAVSSTYDQTALIKSIQGISR